MSIKEHLSWFETVYALSSKDRKRIVATVMDSLSKFSLKGEGHRDNRAGLELVQTLNKEYDLIGISPNVSYLKVKGSNKELNAQWVHPWGTPTLLFKHKELPVVIHVNPGIRFNESFLSEMEHNRDYPIELNGISG